VRVELAVELSFEAKRILRPQWTCSSDGLPCREVGVRRVELFADLLVRLPWLLLVSGGRR
jgi:hypothetical protein